MKPTSKKTKLRIILIIILAVSVASAWVLSFYMFEDF